MGMEVWDSIAVLRERMEVFGDWEERVMSRGGFRSDLRVTV